MRKEGPGRRRPSSSAWAYLGSVTPCRCGSGARMAVPVLAGWLALRQSQQRVCTHQRGSFQWLPQKNSCFLFSAPSILFICILRGVNWRMIWTRKAPKTAKKCTILQSIFFVCRNKEMLGDRSTIPGKSMIICKKQFTYKIQRICIFVDFWKG